MLRLSAFLLLVALGAGCRSTATPVASDALAARILANLRVEFPALGEMSVRVDSLRPMGVDGILEGQLAIAGQQPQPFLYAASTEQLYLLAAPPVDVSRDSVALAATLARRDSAAAAETRARLARLASDTRGLPVLGPPDAPITIVEFSDFQCPYCARAAVTVKQVLAANPDVRLIYAHLPLGNHDWARPSAIAATCAAQQSGDAFWRLHDAYFRDQRGFSAQNVIARSRAALAGSGVDLDAWETCASDEGSDVHRGAAAAVDAQAELASSMGVGGTPGFFVNGRFLNGAQPLEVFQQAVDAARAAR